MCRRAKERTERCKRAGFLRLRERMDDFIRGKKRGKLIDGRNVRK